MALLVTERPIHVSAAEWTGGQCEGPQLQLPLSAPEASIPMQWGRLPREEVEVLKASGERAGHSFSHVLLVYTRHEASADLRWEQRESAS